jgi:hypothetical protein
MSFEGFKLNFRINFFLTKQQRCEILVELSISAFYEGAAHRNIKFVTVRRTLK